MHTHAHACTRMHTHTYTLLAVTAYELTCPTTAAATSATSLAATHHLPNVAGEDSVAAKYGRGLSSCSDTTIAACERHKPLRDEAACNQVGFA